MQWDGTCCFSCLSEKTRKSKCLQLSLQRQLFSQLFFWPWVLVWLGFKPTTSHSAVRRSTNWANQLTDCKHLFHIQQMQPQQQQQQQPGVIPNLMDTAPGAPQPGFPSVTLATGVATNTFPIFPNASVAPQHSAPPVVYNSAQASQLVSKIRQNCPVLRLATVLDFFSIIPNI